MYETSLKHARKAHEGQLDKRGRPYIQHVLEVSQAVAFMGEEYAVVGLLHDVLEDSELKDVSEYPLRIQAALTAITRRPGETYMEYLRRCKKDSIAKHVKIADIKLNYDTCPEEGLRKRYEHALRYMIGVEE